MLSEDKYASVLQTAKLTERCKNLLEMAKNPQASGSVESSGESADETLAPVRGAEGGDAVQSVVDQEDLEMKRAPSATGLSDDGDEKMEEAETTTVEYAELNIDDRTLLDLHGNVNELPLSTKLTDLIVDAYKDVDELGQLRFWQQHGFAITVSVKEALNQPTEAGMKWMKQLAMAFAGSYTGSAHDKFTEYLTRCCAQYRANPTVYIAPYVAITQSSGFGKSRVVCELARKCTTDATNAMRLLYISARTIAGSTGFPVATPELYKFLFESVTVAKIASRLCWAFDYACERWRTVQNEWLEVFSAEGDRVDKELASNLKNWKPPTKVLSQAPGSPVLVVVLDEARSLLAKHDAAGTSYFRLLRRALTEANNNLRKGSPGLIFAVLVDTNSQVHDFVPPSVLDDSSRKDHRNLRLFPPFVLTHTMDVFFKKPVSPLLNDPFSYKDCVLEIDREKIRMMLLSFGRPLWHKHYTSITGSDPLTPCLVLGGSKLLRGLNPSELTSYNNDTLHGVAAVMCRLGLRPQASSPLASQLVASFMAVLHAVKYTYDAHISGYVSEPFLAFAATHVWYEEYPKSLTEHMLPQLRELLMQGIIDVGYVGEMVARLFLLLAMDTAIMGGDEIKGYTLQLGSKRFEGQVLLGLVVAEHPRWVVWHGCECGGSSGHAGISRREEW
ncbi:unnamed protein product [Phytophthora fragariaefolia]|uniref:Unnamed protein product n=1 Tax=Phytophthora fragariaefolia TaxID=1490495 RepID=A0A9W6TYR2_9STRA|nr:unnamed protein product [Phytophthora fragariaefolia]